jgi:hypothetical protein
MHRVIIYQESYNLEFNRNDLFAFASGSMGSLFEHFGLRNRQGVMLLPKSQVFWQDQSSTQAMVMDTTCLNPPPGPTLKRVR